MKTALILIVVLSLGQVSYGQKTILWKVRDTVHQTSTTILGTLHQLGNSFVDSIPEIAAELNQADLAIFESIDNVSVTQKMINDRAASMDIKTGLRKKDYAALLELSKDWKVDLYKLKPIEIRWKLAQEFVKIKCETVKEQDTWDHFDNYVQFLAEEQGIELLGLETNEEQLSYIDEGAKSPTWKDERKEIHYWLDQFNQDDFDRSICEDILEYRNYELDYEFTAECPPNVLIQERNAKWMNLLPRILREKNCFIAVGLFHLYRKCGLLEALREEGFIVTPIELEPNLSK